MLLPDSEGFVNIGSNRFRNVQYPLVVGQRRFELKRPRAGLWLPGALTLDIWVELTDGDRLYEVLDGKPVAHNTKINATGIVTFTQANGRFAFKYRPAHGAKGGSVIFGPGVAHEPLSVSVKDDVLIVNTNKITRAHIDGWLVGIRVDGESFAIGSNNLNPPRTQVA